MRLLVEFFRTTIVFQESITQWLEEADYDSDGKISMEEFKLSIAGNTLVDEVDDELNF